MFLTPDDFEKGLPVVIDSQKYEVNEFATGFNSNDYCAYQDLLFAENVKGVPCEVVAVGLPFVVLRIMKNNTQSFSSYDKPTGKLGHIASVDIRRFNFRKCSRDVLDAFVLESLPAGPVCLRTALGTRLFNLLNRHGLGTFESLARSYRYGTTEHVPGVGHASNKKIENIMRIAGVSRV